MRTIAAFTLAGLLAFPALAAVPVGHGPIPDDLWESMAGVSWHADLPCPPREALALVEVPYRDFEGIERRGRLIVAREEAGAIARVFERVFAGDWQRFASIRPVSEFGGSDAASMRANNTSAFNCRMVSGTDRLSSHALGLAIDVNPVQNPWVKDGDTDPPAGAPFDTEVERAASANPGVAKRDGPLVRAFADEGWSWGGDWNTLKDYQHFSKTGR